MNKYNILDYLSDTNSSFIHAHGEKASNLLVEKLQLKGNRTRIWNFGIIQCNDRFAGIENTCDFFKKHGFDYKESTPINQELLVKGKNNTIPLKLSKIFTLFGKVKKKTIPKYAKKQAHIQAIQSSLKKTEKKYLHGTLFIMEKIKQSN